VSGKWYQSVVPEDEGPGPEIDTSVAHIARVYDYWLGGKDNFAADREAADKAIEIFPGLPASARANRAFLGRAVRYLAREAGIRQFLDIGTGIPTSGNTHEIAQAAEPSSRVVYVDNDPIVLAHARALLTSTPQGTCAYIDADLRDPATILERAGQVIDFSQPVAIMLVAVLHMIPDDDRPWEIVSELKASVPSGSYLTVSHVARDMPGIPMQSMTEGNKRYNDNAAEPVLMRTRDQVSAFFDGLELVEPGLVSVPHWRSEVDPLPSPAPLWCGVARKP